MKTLRMCLRSSYRKKEVLEAWYSTYMNVREKIAKSGTIHRWEFDQKRLFEQSNYMARICENLSEVRFIMCIIYITLSYNCIQMI